MNKKLIIFMPSIEGGGVEKNLFIISNFLSKKKFDIKLITSSKDHIKKFHGIQFKTPSININNYGRKIKYLFCLFLLIKEFFSNKDFLVFSFQANMYCILLSKLFNKKIIIRSNSSPSGWSKNILKKVIFKIIFRYADKIIVNSEEFKLELKKKFNVNSVAIYNPLNKLEILKLSKKKLKFPFFDKDKNSIKIINIGRFTDQKDHLTILKAINNLKNKIKIKLLIIGRGKNLEQMNNYINRNNLKKNIKIINFKLNPYPYLKKSDIFVLASKYEGLPNVLLEAAALKKFIISTDCPTGPKEILKSGKYGYLTKTGNHNNISQKILLFIKEKKKVKLMINKGYKDLTRFDYNYNLNKYFLEINKFYQKLNSQF